MPFVIAFSILALVIVGGLIAHNKLKKEGEIISRRNNFMEQAEIFTLTLEDVSRITEGIRSLPYGTMSVSVKGSSETQQFRFTGTRWKARLFRLPDEGGQAVYRFEFTEWKTHNGMAEDALNMNRLLTALEKMFLSVDPNTAVRTEALELNSKHTLF